MIVKMKESGITLVALVVTIIIILILAGVTISQITGENGLIKRTTQAKEEYEKESLKEEIRLAVLDKRLENNGEISDTDLEGILKKYGKVEGTGKEMLLTPTGKSYKMSYQEIMEDEETSSSGSSVGGSDIDLDNGEGTNEKLLALENRIKKIEDTQSNYEKLQEQLNSLGVTSLNFKSINVDENGGNISGRMDW